MTSVLAKDKVTRCLAEVSFDAGFVYPSKRLNVTPHAHAVLMTYMWRLRRKTAYNQNNSRDRAELTVSQYEWAIVVVAVLAPTAVCRLFSDHFVTYLLTFFII